MAHSLVTPDLSQTSNSDSNISTGRQSRRTNPVLRKINIYLIVAIVVNVCVAMTLIVTGVLVLPNADADTVTIYIMVSILMSAFSLMAGVVLCAARMVLIYIYGNDEEGERERMISAGNREAGVAAPVQDEPAE